MKKTYSEPEFESIHFRFASMMEGGDDPGFNTLNPSVAQDYGEGHGGGID